MIQSIYLRNFRNFEECSLIFAPRINLFQGLNAQGKTNLLEALSLLSLGRSFRTQNLSELIKIGSTFFFLEATLLRDGISQNIRISFDGQNKSVACNATQHHSFQPLLGLIPAVFFTPQDADLIGGSPSIRRRFLNIHLAQSDPLYVHHLIRFNRAVKQRNALLRSHSLEGIDYWEEEMTPSATYLMERRASFLEQLLHCPSLVNEQIEVHYEPSSTRDYLSQLKRQRPREKVMGMTLIGPHRDDFSLLLAGQLARLHASEGQRRSIGALLRLAEWQRLKAETGISPLFCVDDFELHLDAERQKLFQQSLPIGQVFITTPLEGGWNDAQIFHISGGSVVEKIEVSLSKRKRG